MTTITNVVWPLMLRISEKTCDLHFQALSEQLVDDHHVLSLGKAISDALKNSKRYRIELERFWKHKNGSTQIKGWAWYEHEVQALQLLEDWGPKPIPLSFQVLQACGRSEIHLHKMGARGPPVRSKCWIASFSCRIPFMTHQSTSSLDSGPIPSSLLQRGSHCNLCPFEIASSRTYFWPQQLLSHSQPTTNLRPLLHSPWQPSHDSLTLPAPQSGANRTNT